MHSNAGPARHLGKHARHSRVLSRSVRRHTRSSTRGCRQPRRRSLGLQAVSLHQMFAHIVPGQPHQGPRGKNQETAHNVITQLIRGGGGRSIAVDDAISTIAPLLGGPTDKRRTRAREAVEGLAGRGVLRRNNGQLELPNADVGLDTAGPPVLFRVTGPAGFGAVPKSSKTMVSGVSGDLQGADTVGVARAVVVGPNRSHGVLCEVPDTDGSGGPAG
jgi:hypothetical protein